MFNHDWDAVYKERDRILAKHGIKRPQCGFDVGEGWLPIVEEAIDRMVAIGWDRDLHQVKQKFCGLRIYIGIGSPELSEIIKEAERRASLACENCGKPHLLDPPGGMRSGIALCPECRKLP